MGYGQYARRRVSITIGLEVDCCDPSFARTETLAHATQRLFTYHLHECGVVGLLHRHMPENFTNLVIANVQTREIE